MEWPFMKSQTKKRDALYADMMEEVKVRLHCIDLAIQGKTGYPSPIVRELCYLQLRILCELIALACLVAHGDIASVQAHKLGRVWSADEILGRLTRLRPHFYPAPIKQNSKGPGIWHMEGINPSPLPKEELLALYGLTHKYLHRGNLKKLMSMDDPIDMEIDIPEIVKWGQKINDLLRLHVIAIDADNLIIAMLRNANDNNRVQVATAAGKPSDLLT